ncbi:MAG: DUF424 domain-containing protein [Thaumarchaeota archaeon]|nr:MAG: DUF424 domain-containing protein [Nitrososphaerota archaeon]TLX83221.1 MAG: DUF424 domain-containing protein [Nitrososphaerota archaeon]
MPFAVRTVTYQQNKMLNICDADLVGRTLTKSDFTLNISRSYFAERIIEREEAEKLLKTSSIINMVGKETISLSVKMGIGSSKGVKEIDGVPFLLVFKF